MQRLHISLVCKCDWLAAAAVNLVCKCDWHAKVILRLLKILQILNNILAFSIGDAWRLLINQILKRS
jgi:hypothetical protein